MFRLFLAVSKNYTFYKQPLVPRGIPKIGSVRPKIH